MDSLHLEIKFIDTWAAKYPIEMVGEWTILFSFPAKAANNLTGKTSTTKLNNVRKEKCKKNY